MSDPSREGAEPVVPEVAPELVSDPVSGAARDLAREIARRRTFAIISHPDAGKTTLTEKLLLYGGAIQLAGAVKAKRGRASAVSDWMQMERERGISTRAGGGGNGTCFRSALVCSAYGGRGKPARHAPRAINTMHAA